jgi:Holliday junction resolvase-like predicted endonuclease
MSQLFSLDIQNKRSSERSSSKVGQIGEELAAAFLVRNAYLLVAANFKVPVGRNRVGAPVNGEIDLIAYDEGVLWR